jgi:hypothetical protein
LNYNSVTSSAITQVVNKATPTVSWSTPASITYGARLPRPAHLRILRLQTLSSELERRPYLSHLYQPIPSITTMEPRASRLRSTRRLPTSTGRRLLRSLMGPRSVPRS